MGKFVRSAAVILGTCVGVVGCASPNYLCIMGQTSEGPGMFCFPTQVKPEFPSGPRESVPSPERSNT